MESLDNLSVVSDKEIRDCAVAASTVSKEEQFQLCLSLKATMLLSRKSATAFNKCICSCRVFT